MGYEYGGIAGVMAQLATKANLCRSSRRSSSSSRWWHCFTFATTLKCSPPRTGSNTIYNVIIHIKDLNGALVDAEAAERAIS